MRFWKLSPFLALGFLVLYQVGTFQAAPLRSAPESLEHHASLNEQDFSLDEEEADILLLAALIKNSMRRMAAEQEQETQPSVTVQKRACNTGTCLTHKLAGLLSRIGFMTNSHLLPPDMVPKGSGRKARDLDA
ncbi:calcitonin gene-related peptide 1-like [Rhinolophus sinicus]|uniref:calcitonin gene-related peptide 1-like n=1 Tax=Rhinolophus sinicus TaxID=89399 RepID=UPI003D7AFAD5